MGGRIGDTLKLENQWCECVVTKDGRDEYHVRVDGRGTLGTYRLLSEAVGAALVELSVCQRGRVG